MSALEGLIGFFVKRHLVTNLFLLVVFIGGVFSWHSMKKEEMPDVTFNRVRVGVGYPGAPAEDVEHFVVRPLEEVLRGLDGVYRLTSSCSVGQGSVNVELEQGYTNVDEAVTEIRNAVMDVRMPDDVVDDPEVRVFKTSKKAILDVALYHKEALLLNPEQRRELQRIAFSLESRLLSLSQVHSVDRSGYLREEIQIRAYPERLAKFDVPFNTLMREVRGNNIRQPAGTIEAEGEPKVTLVAELKSKEELENLIVQGGFDGRVVRLKEAADVEETFEKTKSIFKVNGHEAVILNVVKSGSAGILESLDAVTKSAREFEKNSLKGSPIALTLLDDESIDVRNRLSLIGTNGAIGFVLIVATLLVFLNKRAGLWVGMGIPFTLCFTLIASWMLGYTVNGTTLAAVIIVMGIVVDDAIVVAENITRNLSAGMNPERAAVEGTAYVFMPVLASITTTCVAFIPLFFFSGHFGRFIVFIPPIIFLMLGSSMFESLFILPGHMIWRLSTRADGSASVRGHWFDRVEAGYGRLMEKIMPFKWMVFAILLGLIAYSGYVVKSKMKFVMFPNEETRDLVLTGFTPKGTDRYETARMTRKIEDIIIPYVGKEVVGFRTMIAQGRRGGAVQENEFRTMIEIVSKEKRKKSSDQLIEEFEAGFKTLKGFEKLQFRKSRWGQGSGSPIELIVQQNNDAIRREIVKELAKRVEDHPALAHAEIDEGLFVSEYRVSINREKVKRLSISPADIASTLRAALEGVVLYEFSNGDEEVRVRLTTTEKAKEDIQKVLSIPVENGRNYLVPLGDLVTVKKVEAPNAIARRDMKRTTLIDADMEKGTRVTPLEVAEDFEKNVFPDILSKYPTTTLSFGGEVQDTRESKDDFRNAAVLALLLIYGILAVLFDSAFKPLFIMLAIPLGIAGVVISFYLHGKLLFGFYAAVGVLGLAGVVINDAIIMLVKLDDDYDPDAPRSESDTQIADIAKTRLRAVVLTTLTTVVGVLPTAYGLAGYDAMLAEMMLALAWGMMFGTVSTLLLVPCLYSLVQNFRVPRAAKSAVAALVLLGVFSSPAKVMGQEASTGPRTLPLEEFIRLTAANDVAFQEILIRGLKLRYSRDLNLPARDFVLAVKEEGSFYLQRDEEDAATSISLSKLFPLTGTEISAGYGYSPTAKSAGSSSGLTFGLSQPIAENAFGRSTRLLDKIVGLETEVARHQIIEAYEDYMAAVMTAYLDWLETYENLAVGESSYQENLKLLHNIKERRKSRIAKEIDVNKIELQVLAKKERLVTLQERYQSALNIVKKAISHKGAEVLVPRSPAKPGPMERAFDAEYDGFSRDGRTHKILRRLDEKSDLKVSREADDLLPSIAMRVSFERDGEQTRIKKRDDKVAAGVTLEFPFFDQRGRAEHRTAKIESERTHLDTRSARDRLKLGARNLFLQMEREKNLMEIAEEKIRLSESVLKDETENYTYAKVTLNDYISAVNVLDGNRFTHIERDIQWRKLRVEWLRITDRLVTEGQIRERHGSAASWAQ